MPLIRILFLMHLLDRPFNVHFIVTFTVSVDHEMQLSRQFPVFFNNYMAVVQNMEKTSKIIDPGGEISEESSGVSITARCDCEAARQEFPLLFLYLAL